MCVIFSQIYTSLVNFIYTIFNYSILTVFFYAIFYLHIGKGLLFAHY